MDEITLRQMQSVAPVRRGEGGQGGASSPAADAAGPSFSDLLLRERAAATPAQSSLKFSAHAQTRLQSRNIPFGPDEAARLEAAVGKAQAKGARESLVLMDGVALVVSVKNRTVITAVDAASLKDSVFTNIDSAVIC